MRSFIFLLLLLPITAWSEPVLQVKGQNFLFKAGSYKAGKSLSILGPNGQLKGTARVKQVGQNQSVGEVISGSIAVGDQVMIGDSSNEPQNPQPKQKTPAKTPRKFEFSVGLAYPVASTGKFSGKDGFDVAMTAEGKSGSSLVLSADFRHWFNESYGMIYGFDYEMERKVDAGLKYTLDGSATTYSIADKFSSMVLHVNFAFRWTFVYMPVGLTYNMITYTTTGTGSVSGGIGYQVGVGAAVWSRAAIEMVYRSNKMTMKIDYPSLETVNFTTGQVTEILLSGRWIF